MKRRALFIPAALVAAAMAGSAPAQAPQAVNSVVQVAGIVSGSPESVSFSGPVRIESRLVPDPDFGRPSLLLLIDLNGVAGVGSSTKAKYVVAAQERVQRRLAASHRVEVSFPFTRTGSTSIGPRSGVAAFDLDFDLNTGAVTRAAGSVATPNF